VKGVEGIDIDNIDSVDGVDVEGEDHGVRISVFFSFFFVLAVYLCWYLLSNYVCVL
jgi:hypothetical protein